jgi:pimeloyl-ACP methyl ester carboxylesterase
MRQNILFGAMALASTAAASPMEDLSKGDILKYFNGFEYPTIISSQGGHARCVQGMVEVNTPSTNVELNYKGPPSQLNLTELVVENLQINSRLSGSVVGPKIQINGTYKINGKICWPEKGSINASAVQILTHGVGFDKSYWDFFSGQYSYVDFMAKKGYTTFSYDRLGVGASEHPDPIKVVQAQTEVEIAHSLIQSLRDGALASTRFQKIIGVGHSLGSILTAGVTSKYPEDLDAAVLTGFSVDRSGFPIFFAGLELVIANYNNPLRFATLPNGYIVPQSKAGNQFGFFRYPNFDPQVLEAADKAKQPLSIGEFFTNAMVLAPAPDFSGPIDVVDGENDLPFCQGNCLNGGNRAAEVKGALYPAGARGSDSFILKGAGHALNLHFGAETAYAHIANFINKNEF